MKAIMKKSMKSSVTEKHKVTQVDDTKQQLIHKLFPNKEYVKINDNLTVEVKYGEGMTEGYTYDYMKGALKEVYKDWCNNFYKQESNNSSPVKIQLYVFKSVDEYEKYMKEISGKDLWGGGTMREHESDGTIAKTFIFGGSLPCAKSSYLMEKMSDAFLEYATGDLESIPQALRVGMSAFMWSNGFAKSGMHDMSYMKEARNEIQNQTPYDIINMDKSSYQASDCLVKFLQDKYPSLISKLISDSSKIDIKSELKKNLKNPEVEEEFKDWMLEQSGEKMVENLVPDSDSMLFENYKIKVDIKYDGKKLSDKELENIKNAIEDSVKEYDSAFDVNTPFFNANRNLSVFVFNTEQDYQNYLKTSKGESFYMGSSGVTTVERHDFHVHFYLQNDFANSYKTLKHEMGHALNIMNSYHATGVDVPLAMHEGIANYIAGLEKSKHVNDHGDIEALLAIKTSNLKADEILNDNYRGKHYYSEAEQVIKFLENKHPNLIDGLLKILSTPHKYNHEKGRYEITREEFKQNARDSIEKFMEQLKGYNSEFQEWVKEQINDQSIQKGHQNLHSWDSQDEQFNLNQDEGQLGKELKREVSNQEPKEKEIRSQLNEQKYQETDNWTEDVLKTKSESNSQSKNIQQDQAAEQVSNAQKEQDIENNSWSEDVLKTNSESNSQLKNVQQDQAIEQISSAQKEQEESDSWADSVVKAISNTWANNNWIDNIMKTASDAFNWFAGDDEVKREKRDVDSVILKDTILKVEKSHDEGFEGKYKANVVIDYYDIKSLFDKAEESEKHSVLDFWNKLHESKYKIGVLPEDKYYFTRDKFFIHDDQENKCIVLPENKIFIKIMKQGDDYNLVISNEQGKVINSVSKVDNLNYDLLSHSGNLNLESYDSIELANQQNEYDLYLINGLGGEMFNCNDDHNHHSLF